MYIQTEVGISDELKKKVIGYYEYLVCKTLKEAIAVTVTTGMTTYIDLAVYVDLAYKETTMLNCQLVSFYRVLWQ